jgi:uncharacterized protein with von Willebrand factor type A (vWA) domain
MNQFEQLRNTLSILVDDFGRLWDLSSGFWRKINFNSLHKYAQFFENNNKIQELVDILGRTRQQESEYEEDKTKKIIKKINIYDKLYKQEYVGVTQSDDLASIVPSELALLSDTLTESIFFKKYIEKKHKLLIIALKLQKI